MGGTNVMNKRFTRRITLLLKRSDCGKTALMSLPDLSRLALTAGNFVGGGNVLDGDNDDDDNELNDDMLASIMNQCRLVEDADDEVMLAITHYMPEEQNVLVLNIFFGPAAAIEPNGHVDMEEWRNATRGSNPMARQLKTMFDSGPSASSGSSAHDNVAERRLQMTEEFGNGASVSEFVTKLVEIFLGAIEVMMALGGTLPNPPPSLGVIMAELRDRKPNEQQIRDSLALFVRRYTTFGRPKLYSLSITVENVLAQFVLQLLRGLVNSFGPAGIAILNNVDTEMIDNKPPEGDRPPEGQGSSSISAPGDADDSEEEDAAPGAPKNETTSERRIQATMKHGTEEVASHADQDVLNRQLQFHFFWENVMRELAQLNKYDYVTPLPAGEKLPMKLAIPEGNSWSGSLAPKTEFRMLYRFALTPFQRLMVIRPLQGQGDGTQSRSNQQLKLVCKRLKQLMNPTSDQPKNNQGGGKRDDDDDNAGPGGGMGGGISGGMGGGRGGRNLMDSFNDSMRA